jgi:hypothetical protein
MLRFEPINTAAGSCVFRVLPRGKCPASGETGEDRQCQCPTNWLPTLQSTALGSRDHLHRLSKKAYLTGVCKTNARGGCGDPLRGGMIHGQMRLRLRCMDMGCYLYCLGGGRYYYIVKYKRSICSGRFWEGGTGLVKFGYSKYIRKHELHHWDEL